MIFICIDGKAMYLFCLLRLDDILSRMADRKQTFENRQLPVFMGVPSILQWALGHNSCLHVVAVLERDENTP